MMHTCNRCERDFLTEIEPQILKLERGKWEVYYTCEIIDLQASLKLAMDALREVRNKCCNISETTEAAVNALAEIEKITGDKE